MKITINTVSFIIALALATVGAAVSLYGLVAMFSLAFLPLGAGLEAGKLTAAAALHHSWNTIGWRIRYTLTAIVVVLMSLTSAGVYGFVLTQYLAHVGAITAPVAERIAAADEAVNRQADKVADLDKQIAALDAAPVLEIANTAKPRTASQIAAQAKAQAEAAKLRLADEQRRAAKREILVAKRDNETAELARLRTVRTEIGSQQKAAEAEIGPVRLIADALDVDPGKIVAGAIASIFDALCVLLLLVSNHKPSAPVETEQPLAYRRPTRSEAAKSGWETRRRKKLEAAYRRGPIAVQ
jgi:hypothetical protein